MVDAGLVDCIVNLPAKLFLNTEIPASLWFLSSDKARLVSPSKFRSRTDEILFIDARNLGVLINRRTLRQYGYPPDMQRLATETVLKQAEMMAMELTNYS
jgi:type I restriction enzyme M protein